MPCYNSSCEEWIIARDAGSHEREQLRPRRIDQNQPAIVAALRNTGVYVFHSHTLGGGFPDLVCYNAETNRLRLVEVKMLGEKLNAKEARFHQMFGHYCAVVATEQEAVRLMLRGGS